MDPILEPSPTPRAPGARRRWSILAGAIGALVIGAAAAASALSGPSVTLAASSIASPAPAASSNPTRPPHGLGPNHEAVSDTSVAAKAIGITESELQTALSNGETMAAVARAKGVDVQSVIDALVADANSEIATAVSNGQLTQAQADAEKAEVTQRVTDQVNGTFMSGHGHGLGPNPGTTGSATN